MFLNIHLLFAQNSEFEPKEKYLFKEVSANFSMVNLGIINNWSVPLNIDTKRPYMHFGIGVQGSLTKNTSVRLDYFSIYNNFISKNIFNPSVITISPRFTFNKNNSVNPFIDLKAGIAIVKSEDQYILDLVSKTPVVIGIRTGINTRIGKNIFLGFSFDNLVICYKFINKIYWNTGNNYNNSYTGNNSYVGYIGRDASQISVLTTDIVYNFKK